MSMIKKFIAIGTLGGFVMAAPHSIKELENIAVNFASSKIPDKTWQIGTSQQKSFLSTEANFHGNCKLIHLKPSGWVIVSTDDVARPVLAYNLKKDNTGIIPVNFKKWMEQIDNQIEWAKNNHNPTFLPQQWKTLTQSHEKFLQKEKQKREAQSTSSQSASVKGPLLQTTWDQGKYYNTKCPADTDGPDGHVWAGCVATAMTQIMKYYNWPVKGKGSHSYDSDYGTLSADFGHTRYDWKSMPDKVTSYNDAVATLLFHAGVAVNMHYSPEGSGASTSQAGEALKTYFRYGTSGNAYKENMSDEEWDSLLKRELDADRPILYRGSGSGGHAFICDGYDYSDPDNKTYHFNWGWSGYYNGYYAIGALNPANRDYSEDNMVVYGILPIGKMRAPANVSATNIKKTSIVLRWKDRTKNEKGFRIYQGETLLKEVKANVTRTKIRQLIPGTRYTLRVAAYRSNAESRRVPVRFKTKGRRPQILPIQFDQVTEGQLRTRKESSNRPGRYAEYYTFKLKENADVTIQVKTGDFYAGIFLMDGRTKDGNVLYQTHTYTKGTLSKTINLEAGTYTVEVTSYYEHAEGKFTIELTK